MSAACPVSHTPTPPVTPVATPAPPVTPPTVNINADYNFKFFYHYTGHRTDQSSSWRTTLDQTLFVGGPKPGISRITSLQDLTNALTKAWTGPYGPQLSGDSEPFGYGQILFTQNPANTAGGRGMKQRNGGGAVVVLWDTSNLESFKAYNDDGYYVLVPGAWNNIYEWARGGDADVKYEIPFSLYGPRGSVTFTHS